jgi:hypothetical protein
MDCLYWIHLSVSIGKEFYVKAFAMNTHTKNAVLSEIYVLIV